MQLAEAWYSPTSASFWADAIAFATIVATVIVGRQALPRRRLDCTVVSRSRLMNAPQEMRDNLKVSYEDKSLGDPYVVAFEIASTGRSAIPSTSFDKDRSLQLSLEAEILTLLSVEHEPASAAKPTINAKGNAIELMPELIARREVVKVSLLTEGTVGRAAIAFNPFSDVKLGVRDREATELRRRKWYIIAPSVIALLAAIAIAAGTILTVQNLNNRNNELAGSTMCLTMTAFGQSTDLALKLAYRDIRVNRFTNGSIKSVKFTSSYDSDVAEVKQDAQFLLAGYTAFNDSQTKRMSAGLKGVVTILPVLPKEGTGSAENRDLSKVEAVLNQMSNPNYTAAPKTVCP